jgi:hypothetical protein
MGMGRNIVTFWRFIEIEMHGGVTVGGVCEGVKGERHRWAGQRWAVRGRAGFRGILPALLFQCAVTGSSTL